MDPVVALRRIAFLLEREQAETYRVQAFRKAAYAVAMAGPEDTRARLADGRLQELDGVGKVTAEVITESLLSGTPAYLQRLEDAYGPLVRLDEDAQQLMSALRGDLHSHTDWSDGGSPIEDMAVTAMELGREYQALTDHSPRLKVANGLTTERLRKQLGIIGRLAEGLLPFRLLTGIEVDILDDGALDQTPQMLERLDVVVASVHSKLRMGREDMTRRMLAAVADPHIDILGHCTGRMVTGGKSRPPSDFDAKKVFAACAERQVAVEINCRPERLDPPRRLLKMAVDAGCLFSIDTDAHAPGQLDWLGSGVARAAECGVPAERVVTTWEVDRLLEWTRRPR